MFLKDFAFEKVNFEKKYQLLTKMHAQLPACKDIKLFFDKLGCNFRSLSIFSTYNLMLALKRNTFERHFSWVPVTHIWAIKGIFLSKALTCMKFFLFKQKWLFYQGDGYLWLYCCTNNLYISHGSFYSPTYSFWASNSKTTDKHAVDCSKAVCWGVKWSMWDV